MFALLVCSSGERGAVDMELGGPFSARLHSARSGLLLADECHMVPAPRIGELLQSLLKPGRRLVGLTATLMREGDKANVNSTGRAEQIFLLLLLRDP